MFCPKCGQQAQEGAGFCSVCGNMLNAQPQQQQQQYYHHQPMPYIPRDIPTGGIKALCFFFPVIGLILYLVKKDTEPISARAYGKFAIIGFVFSIILSIFYVVLFLTVFREAVETVAYHW